MEVQREDLQFVPIKYYEKISSSSTTTSQRPCQPRRISRWRLLQWPFAASDSSWELEHLHSHARRGPRHAFFSSGRRKSAQSRPQILVFARIWAFIHPASPGHPRPSGARSGTPDERNAREKARKIPARSRGSCGPDLSARVGGRRPHRLVFRASSSPHASTSARCKGCRQWTASHAARRVNASVAI
jgi:hypothetical protein